MSRYHPEGKSEPILRAAAHWCKVALERDGSVFTDQSIWTLSNIEALVRPFVEALDFGEGNYIEKLSKQLDEDWRLMEEKALEETHRTQQSSDCISPADPTTAEKFAAWQSLLES